MTTDRTNDGTQASPYLRKDINLGTILKLPHGSVGYRAHLHEQLALLKADGHIGAQSWNQFDETMAAGLRATGMARITVAQQADGVARDHKARGLDATTIHLGTSFESDAEIDVLVASVLEAAAKHSYAMYIETHRATLTQDIRRTVDMVERFPEVRFNVDLSHYYTGHELTYGGEFDQRVERLSPIFERTRFMHGRISNSGCIQAPVSDEGVPVAHFRAMWQRCFEGFLRGAQTGDYLSFNAELLPMRIGTGDDTQWLHYAQQRPAHDDDPLEGEPTDRFLEVRAIWEIASEAFSAAQHNATMRATP
jgi:hypothetical protein